MADGLTMYQEFLDSLADIEASASETRRLGVEYATAKRDYEREKAVALSAMLNAGRAATVAKELAKGERAVLEAGERMDTADYWLKAEQMLYSAKIRKSDMLKLMIERETGRIA
jgi:methylphosphotriester-DNA--protein-cysteine methyltransferase